MGKYIWNLYVNRFYGKRNLVLFVILFVAFDSFYVEIDYACKMLFLVFFKYYDKSFYVRSNRTFLGLSFFKCPVFKQERYVSDDTTGEIQMVAVAA